MAEPLLGSDTNDFDVRLDALLSAEAIAHELFAAIEARQLVRPGVTERELSDAVKQLASELFGIKKFWHKRIVRSGINSVEPYRSNPANLTLTEDDIVFFDFGPILEEWEADFGRTYVLGQDPVKLRLAADLPVIWAESHQVYRANPAITAAEFYAAVTGIIAAYGWGHATAHVGHLIGEFPHERINGDEIDCYLAPANDLPMRRLDADGHRCHWILEIHLVEPDGTFGGFFEQLLTD